MLLTGARLPQGGRRAASKATSRSNEATVRCGAARRAAFGLTAASECVYCPPMLVSIGILAWNEADVIEKTLASLFQQSALRGPAGDMPDIEWEIIVVPNGCSDDTAERARRVLADQVAATGRKDIAWVVHEIAEPGKSNAWNCFVHELSSVHAELIVMLDADIEFGEQETISNTVRALLADPHAAVAVDQPIKSAARKPNKTLIERFSVAASGTSNSGPPAITGQFFCARAKALRDIWMPKGLSVEDGFLRAMIVTDGFRSPADESKVIRAPNASHYFETLTSIRSIFRHELRIVIGSALNCYLNWDFLLFATDPNGPGAGALIRNLLEKNPDWYRKLITNSIRNHGYWVLPRGMLLRRFSNLTERRGQLPKRLAVATAGFLLDLPIFVVANHRLKHDKAIGFW
jgi:glycosyltransferase involved in cell wall biosynthesis